MNPIQTTEAKINSEKTPAGLTPMQERLLLLILAVIQFTHVMDFVVMMPLGDQLRQAFGIDARQFGLLVSAYTFSAGIFGFVGSFFIDRFDRKTALLTLYAGFIVGTFCCAIAPTYGILMTARVLTGAFGGMLGALVLVIIGDAIPFERRGRATGAVMSAFSFASSIGVPLALYVADPGRFNWHGPFFILAGLSVVFLGVGIWAIPAMRGHLNGQRKDPLAAIRTIVNTPSQQWSLALMAVLMLSAFSIIPYLAMFIVSNVGFKQSELFYVYLTGGIVGFFASLLAGRLADRYGSIRVFTVSCVLAVIPMLIITNLGDTPIPVALIVFAFFFIFNNARMVPATTLVTSSVAPQTRAGFMSINAALRDVTAGCASFIGGMIIAQGEGGRILHFGWVGVFAAVTALSCVWIVRNIKQVS
jgi:predicted MFS family arabinose efflux permease